MRKKKKVEYEYYEREREKIKNKNKKGKEKENRQQFKLSSVIKKKSSKLAYLISFMYRFKI
jgi:hypothetical protein